MRNGKEMLRCVWSQEIPLEVSLTMPVFGALGRDEHRGLSFPGQWTDLREVVEQNCFKLHVQNEWGVARN